MTTPANPLRQRQDELIEEIMEILAPHITEALFGNPRLRYRLRTAIAQYTLKIKEQE